MQEPEVKQKVPKEKKVRIKETDSPMAPKPRVKKPRKHKEKGVFSIQQGPFVVSFN